MMSQLQKEIFESKKDHTSVSDAARKLATDLQEIKAAQIEAIGKAEQAKANREAENRKRQQNSVSGLAGQGYQGASRIGDNVVLEQDLMNLKREHQNLAQQVADAEVLLLRTPEVTMSRRIVQIEKLQNPLKISTVTNASLLDGLQVRLNTLESELIDTKNENSKLIAENRAILVEIDIVNKTLSDLRKGIIVQAPKVETSQTPSPGFYIQETTTLSAPVSLMDQQSLQFQAQLAHNKHKVAQYQNEVIPRLEAALQAKNMEISDLENQRNVESQSVLKQAIKADVVDTENMLLVQNLDQAEIVSRRKDFEISRQFQSYIACRILEKTCTTESMQARLYWSSKQIRSH